MNPTKEQMYQWYVVEKKSYRQIMSIMGINSARKVKKILTEYGIEIRYGSEAVKTQWIDNEERKQKQSEFLKGVVEGKPSSRRISDKSIDKRLEKIGVSLINRSFVEGYTHLFVKCNVCFYEYNMNLKNLYGCTHCANKRIHEQQRTPFEVVQNAFVEAGVFLIDTEYINASTPLAYICPKHASLGEQKQSYNGVKERGACKYCRIEKRRTVKKIKLPARDALNIYLKEWRVSVFKRDNFTCQCCGYNKGSILRAHHINNFSSHPHLRLDVENGITLCKDCHDPQIVGSFHHTYGTRNNTAEQLEQYIKDKQKSLA